MEAGLTCIVDEEVQPVFGVQEVLGKLSDRVQRGQVQVSHHHVTISRRPPDLRRRPLSPGQVSARHDDAGT